MRAYVHACVKERGRGREVEREVGGREVGEECMCEDPQGQQLSLHSFPRLRGRSVGQSVSVCVSQSVSVCVWGGSAEGQQPSLTLFLG